MFQSPKDKAERAFVAAVYLRRNGFPLEATHKELIKLGMTSQSIKSMVDKGVLIPVVGEKYRLIRE